MNRSLLHKNLHFALLSMWTLFGSTNVFAQDDAENAAPGDDDKMTSLSDEKQAVYKEYKSAAERYRKEVSSYKLDLRRTLMSDYQTRLSSVDNAYSERIETLRSEEAVMRADVIKRMEDFLKRYGDSNERSADILYRLARLYYEEADEAYLNDNSGKMEYADFTKTLDMLDRLERNFPDYYQMDGVLYLKGYCLQQMDRGEEGKDTFISLLERYPDTTRRAEVYTRIGEYYFEQSQDAILGFGGQIMWDKALEYYTKAVEVGNDTSVYDRALYRKAWTEYYTDDYDHMIRDFITLVGFADRSPNGSALRTEAIDFMAAALAEEDWDLTDDVAMDPDYGIKRFDKYLNNGEPFELEVLRKFADTLAEQTRYEYAADAYDTYINRSPCADDMPEVVQIFISVLNQSGQVDRAAREQVKIASRIGSNSDWYKCQEEKGNFEAMASADTIFQKAIKNSIIAYHDLVTRTEDAMVMAQYTIEDQSASNAERAEAQQKLIELEKTYKEQNIELAELTAEFVKRFPNDEESYNYRYLLGQAYFYGGEYEKSIETFMKIRDVKNARFQNDTARYIADAWELIVARKAETEDKYIYALTVQNIAAQINKGRLSVDMVPMSLLLSPDTISARFSKEQLAAARSAKKCAPNQTGLPEEVTNLVEAREKFSEIENASGQTDPDRTLAPQYRYDNAMIYYNYGDYDEAEKRFNLIIENNPASNHAVSAAEIIISHYEDCNQLDKVAELSDKFAQMNLGASTDSSDTVLNARFTDLKYQALFKIAFQLFDDKKYLEAAAEFLRIIEENPTFEHNNLALYNAAFAYEQMKYYDSSMQLYRRVLKEYGKTKEAVDALYRIGVNAEKFFDFDTAIDSFLSLYNNKSENYQAFAHRVDALRSAARIKLLTEDQKGAAELLVRYHKDFPSQDDAPAFLYQAGRVYAEIGNISQAQKIFSELRSKYTSVPNVRPYIIASYTIEGKYYRAQNKSASKSKAREYFQLAVSLYQNAPASSGDLGRMNAAEAAYNLVDMDREEWAAEKISGKMKVMIEKLKDHMAKMQTLSSRFSAINNYGVKTWALAATYQKATMMHDTVDMLENINRPSDIPNGSDAHLAFLSSMSDMATGARDAAIKAYQETIDAGRYVPGGTDWTKKAVDGLKQLDRTASSLERMLNATELQNAGTFITNKVWTDRLAAEKAAAEAEKAAADRAQAAKEN